MSPVVLLVACGSSNNVDKERGGVTGAAKPNSTASRAASSVCPAEADAPKLLPRVEPKHRQLSYWLDQLGKRYKLDEVLMTPAQIRTLDAAIAHPREGYFPQRDLLEKLDPAEYAKKAKDRVDWAADKLSKGEYVRADGSPLPDATIATIKTVDMSSVDPELYVAVGPVDLRCAPIPDKFHSKDKARVNTRFDRNACSTARAQEVVQVLKRWPNGMRLARTRYAFGWIAKDAPLSPAIPKDKRDAFVRAPRHQLLGRSDVPLASGGTVKLREGILLPVAKRGKHTVTAYVATARGFVQTKPLPTDELRTTARPLTRRAVLQEAWRYLDTPYGLGGVGGGRDCSRFLLDVFETFGIDLPRHSAWQSLAGQFSIDLKGTDEKERMLLIDLAAKRGLVLLHFPGHIMLYLGRNDAGKPMAIHAFAEYKKSCAQKPPGQPADEPAETLMRVKTVTVSDLEVGRGTSRTSFIERLTRATVLGKLPGRKLRGVATLRPPAPVAIPAKHCRDSTNNALWVSPERPYKGAAMRVIGSTSHDPGPVAVALIDPDGVRHTPELTRVGGPPFGMLATVDTPKPGTWKAVLGDGDRTLACQRIYVRSHRSARKGDSTGPVWKPTRRWSRSTENLYSLFIERLFDYPIDKDQTWPNLHTLLRDKAHNILYNHRNLGEDDKITMQPDCADLPIALRTYFAWKMRLPMAYRKCRRAHAGKPPRCNLPGDGNSLMSRLDLHTYKGKKYNTPRGDLSAFKLFARSAMWAIHSSSGRTRPDDEQTDLYPVELTRQALRPGTVYVDPFGHVLMIADWVPQGKGNNYGILLGADAQPDGTIGRRRFWRGSFLFHPETEAGGAGFKAWRPVYWKKSDQDADAAAGKDDDATRVGRTHTWTNRGLARTKRFSRFSKQQYEGSKDDFYDTMESLINPRPLDPIIRQVALVDALAESIARRVNSVDNGEEHMKKVHDKLMALPRGAHIFLSADPRWEAYSTPSRDNRLLISIDSVLGFPDAVKRAPQRFGLEKGPQLDAEVKKVRARLKKELASRTFTYTRSDGSKWKLTLQDIVDRQKGFEMAYNPNDCVEIRWAAPKGSDERSTCKRHAPASQRAQMQTYRHWFSSRKRPPN